MNSSLDRRRFLGAAGSLLALPMLESFAPKLRAAAQTARARRLVCVGAYLGLHTPALYPKSTGADYEITPTLRPLQDLRSEFTLFSGLDHRAGGGHGNWPNYLCGKKIGDISLDQRVAAVIGDATRFPSLVLSAGGGGVQSMCYMKGNVALPALDRPSTVYQKLFASAADRSRAEYLLKSGKSALDFVTQDARILQKSVTAVDRDKLEEYFTSVREVEKRIGKQLSRISEVVPSVDYVLPSADPVAPNLMIECESVLYDLMALALQTDSSRVISLAIPGGSQVFTVDGKMLRQGYHALSHHGNDPEKIEELIEVDRENMRCLAGFLKKLQSTRDAEGKPLLDTTLVMFGTGMGDASRHSNEDLPTIVAGGGLKHGRHLAFSRTSPENDQRLLGDLFITMQRQLGIEATSFSGASRSLDDLLV
jgi:hypothetical protein